jgi:predicted GIY-YIG superfamily endonuclease
MILKSRVNSFIIFIFLVWLVMVDNGKDKYLYLYLDNESMTGYVGETKNLKKRHMEHKGDIWPGRRELVSKIGEPVVIKTDFKSMNAVRFAEHAVYEKYKAEGYTMLQKPPHPNIFKKYHDRVNSCQICDELGCDFSKDRLDYILAVHRVSKLCDECGDPFYFDPVKHKTENRFNDRIYCSTVCRNKGIAKNTIGVKRSKTTEAQIGSKNHMSILTEQDVFEIKSYLLVFGNLKDFASKIARVYGVKPHTIRDIKNGKIWPQIDVKSIISPKEYDELLKHQIEPCFDDLTVAKVRMIKVMLRSDIKTLKQIANLFNVSIGAISHIKQGISWPDV